MVDEENNANLKEGLKESEPYSNEPYDVTTIQGKLNKAKAIKDEGNALYKNHEFKRAIRKYRTVFAYVNGLIEPGNQYAQYSSNIMEPDQAEEVKTIKASTYSNLASAYMSIDMLDKAMDCVRKGEALDSDHIKLKYKKAQICMKQKKYDKAKDEIKGLIQKEPKNGSFRKLLEEWKVEYMEWKQENKEKEKHLFGGKF